MGAMTQGTITPYPWLTIVPKTQFGIAQQFYASRVPLTARLPSAPIQNYKFNMINWPFRGRTTTLTTAIAATGTTSFVVADASFVMNGDVLVTVGGEVVEVTADPNLSTNTLTVRRGAAGTTALATIAAGTTLVNIGNSRTGGEKFQTALQQIPTTVTQYVQTFQHVVSVSGIVQDMGAGLPLPANAPAGPYPQNRMNAMRNLMDDVEMSSLFGFGEDITSATVNRPKQIGLLNFLVSNSVGPASGGSPLVKNAYARQPTSPSAYKPTNFITDVLQPIRAKGGNPTVVHISSGWMAGLAEWANTLQRVTVGETSFGVKVEGIVVPILGNVTFVENIWLNQIDPTLATHTALVLTEDQVRFRTLHPLDYQPYARVGDTGPAANNGEGDWITRLAIEADNEPFHGFVTGISGFAAQT